MVPALNYGFSRPFSSPRNWISSMFQFNWSTKDEAWNEHSNLFQSVRDEIVFKLWSINFKNSAFKFVNFTENKECRIKFIIPSNKFSILSFKFVQCYWASTPGRRIWLKLWRKWMPINDSFCCLVLSYCDRRIWIAMGDKARN